MAETEVMVAVAFAAVCSLTLLLMMLLGGKPTRLDRRLRSLAHGGDPTAPPPAETDPVAEFARTALPKMGAMLLPDKEEERTKLQSRLIHAGLYSRQAMVFFLGVKLLLMVGPPLIGALVGMLGLAPLQQAVVFGALLGIFGMIGPSFWLDMRKASRQS